jgi:hypothetical protein
MPQRESGPSARAQLGIHSEHSSLDLHTKRCSISTAVGQVRRRFRIRVICELHGRRTPAGHSRSCRCVRARTARDPLLIVFYEEWEHRLCAERDLDTLQAHST